MLVDPSKVLRTTDLRQNFSKAMRLLDKEGELVVFKNNKPKYLMIDLDKEPQIDMTEDEKILFVASRILNKYRQAFEELAK